MMDVTVHQLLCFDAVVTEGSFQAAAAKMRRAQPSVSLAVKSVARARICRSLWPGESAGDGASGIDFNSTPARDCVQTRAPSRTAITAPTWQTSAATW